MTADDRKTLEALANNRDNDRHAHAESQEFSAYTLAVNDAAAIRAALAEIDRLRAAAAEERHHCESALRIELEHVAEAVMGAPVERVDPSAVAAEARRLRAALAKGDADDVSDWRRFAKTVVGDYADSHGADDCESEYLRLHAQRTEDAAAFARDEIAALRARNTRLAETVEIARELVQYDWLDSLDDSARSNDVRRDVARLDAQFRATTTKETP